MPQHEPKNAPELVFCLCAPVGSDLDAVQAELTEQLHRVGYDAVQIHITDYLREIRPSPKAGEGFGDRVMRLIEEANALRERIGVMAAMAYAALTMIRRERFRISGSETTLKPGVAYIVRQLKRPEEIALLREVYGKRVFQISVHSETSRRRTRLVERMRDADPAATRGRQFENKAGELLDRDEFEGKVEHGQRLRDVFPLADAFIDSDRTRDIGKTVERLVRLVFGYNYASPTRDEHGMYLAKSAALRSLDLSRQVGAAVFSAEGEVKVLGTNEVPSRHGGTYWDGDEPESREYVRGTDTNEEFKHKLLSDALHRLAEVGVVTEEYGALDSRSLLARIKTEKGVDLGKQLLLMDMIEYGRIIHAEMNAITDAARLGISLKDATLFCTTFPCHLCAKHIIAAGIKRVVYIEPYPKSYATELYPDEIVLGRPDTTTSPECDHGRVRFEPFIGIAPFRYRDFFEKQKRKGPDGRAQTWMAGTPVPIVGSDVEAYIVTEEQKVLHFASLLAATTPLEDSEGGSL
ncbi:anti-phage dCTP deaminase [Salinarimonas ramus]|uniref:Cytidine deaminase n=1 Tax=Salinarimonas ramus TaxID=690164 RepID=A0A917V3R3_9HYPH|nr:anti-phage dCTP deaminase [Salinarimonas ramus]GGK33038.1 cytidine deaminase [Salinarimonas ramus]